MMPVYTLARAEVAPPPILEVVLLKGGEALTLLQDRYFQSDWKILLQSCPWGTVYQGPEFVTFWYSLFGQQYMPVVVVAKAAGKMVGLVTLAKARGKKLITGAGGQRADYHCWLCEAGNGQEFIKAALRKVEQEFTGHEVNFTYLPPDTPLDWVEKDPHWKQKSVLKSYKRLLMDFEVPDRDKLLFSNGFGKKVNRLSKIGKLSFERISSEKEFQHYFPIFADQFDLRKGALENVLLFKTNNVMRRLLSMLFEQGLLYFTVMKVGEQVVATQIGLIGQDGWYHGLFNTHAPQYGKYSPGIVSFLMLAQRLAGEGIRTYDLGPGQHAYKLRLSNAEDEIYQLRIFSGADAAVKKSLFKFLRTTSEYLALKTGLEPRIVKSKLLRQVKLFRERLAVLKVRDLVRAAAKLKLSDSTEEQGYNIYVADADKLMCHEGACSIRKVALGDLLCLDETEGLFTRREFLGEAMKRLEAGEVPYTWVEKDTLLACAWVKGALEGEQVEGLYFHRSAKAHSNAFLAQIIRELAQEPASKVYVVAEKSDRQLVGALNKAGYSIVPS